MKWRWLLLGAVAVVGGCGAALSIAAHNDAIDAFQQRRAELEAGFVAHGPRFRSDLQALSAWPQLQKRSGGRECGALLADKLPFRKDGAVHYPQALPKNIADAVDDCVVGKFPKKLAALDVGAVDTSWMKELAGCDHWDLFASPAVARLRPLHLDTMPLPSLVDAKRWAMVRLLQGLRDGHVKEAGAEVEDLERLLATSELSIVERSAGSLFQYERAAYQAAQAQGLDVAGWAPLDGEAIAAYARVNTAWRAFTDLHARLDAIDPDLWSAPAYAVGRCAAIQEGARVLLQIEPVSAEMYGDAHALLGAALAATRDTCRLTRTREAWDRPGQTSILVGKDALCDPEDGSCVVTSVGAAFPGLREAMVEELGTLDGRAALDPYAHLPKR